MALLKQEKTDNVHSRVRDVEVKQTFSPCFLPSLLWAFSLYDGSYLSGGSTWALKIYFVSNTVDIWVDVILRIRKLVDSGSYKRATNSSFLFFTGCGVLWLKLCVCLYVYLGRYIKTIVICLQLLEASFFICSHD